MNKNNISMQDDKLRSLLHGTKLKADERLKFRIMQQIITEKALTKKTNDASRPIMSSMIYIFGIMYALIIIVGVGTYYTMGAESIRSSSFYTAIILISVVCSTYWMITSFDERRHSRKKK